MSKHKTNQIPSTSTTINSDGIEIKNPTVKVNTPFGGVESGNGKDTKGNEFNYNKVSVDAKIAEGSVETKQFHNPTTNETGFTQGSETQIGKKVKDTADVGVSFKGESSRSQQVMENGNTLHKAKDTFEMHIKANVELGGQTIGLDTKIYGYEKKYDNLIDENGKEIDSTHDTKHTSDLPGVGEAIEKGVEVFDKTVDVIDDTIEKGIDAVEETIDEVLEPAREQYEDWEERGGDPAEIFGGGVDEFGIHDEGALTDENGNPIELASTDASDAQALVDQYNESQENQATNSKTSENQEAKTQTKENSQERTTNTNQASEPQEATTQPTKSQPIQDSATNPEASTQEPQKDKQANSESQTHESNESSQEETPAETSILSGGQTASIFSDTVYGAYSEHWRLNQAFIYNIKKAA